MRRIGRIIAGGWLLMLLASPIGAQGWVRSLGGDANDVAAAIQRTSDGGLIVAGYTQSFGVATPQYWVLKLDDVGVIQWQKSYRIDGTQGTACCVAQAADGGYIVAGNSQLMPGSQVAPWILKLDSSGAITWQEGTGQARVYEAVALADGGAALLGRGGSSPGPEWILRLDAAGVPVWQYDYTLPDGVTASAMQPTSDGGLVVASVAIPSTSIWILRLDASGIAVRQKAIAVGSGFVQASPGLSATSDGGWIVSGWLGWRDIPPDGYFNPFVLKLDATLNPEWAFQFSTGDSACATSSGICQTSDGGYVLAGGVTPQRDDVNDAFAIKLDATGAIQWQRFYGGSGPDSAADVVAMQDGGAAVVGVTAPSLYSAGDALVLRLDLSGNIATTCGIVTDALFVATSLAVTTTDTSASGLTVGTGTLPTSATGLDTTARPGELGDMHEHDDSCALPGVFHDFETTRHDFCDDPEDWFELLACAGATYSMITSNLDPLTNTVIEVVSPDCLATLASDDDGGGGRSSRIDWTAPADGRYRVRIRQLDATIGADRGYDVALTRSGPGCATWARTYGHLGGEATAVRVFPDGTIAVLGTTPELGWMFTDSVVARLGASGDVLWHERYMGNRFDWANDIEVTTAGGLVVAGSSEPSAFILSLDALGAIQWQKSYGRGSSSGLDSITRTRDGGLVAVGQVRDAGGTTDLWILRLDSSGNPSWDLALGGTGFDRAADVVETSDRGLVVLGSFAAGNRSIIRLDASGAVEWRRTYQLGSSNAPFRSSPTTAIVEAADGGLLVAVGNSVTRLDRDGAVMWRQVLVGVESWSAFDLVAKADGGCVVVGGTLFSGGTPHRPVMFALNASGHIEWQRIATSDLARSVFTGVAKARDGGYVVSGSEAGFQVLRVDRDGRLRDSCLLSDASFVASSRATVSAAATAVPVPGTLVVTDATFVPVDPGTAYEADCAGSAMRPPWEVSPPGSIEPLIFTDPSTLRWEQAAASGAATFNLYRGDVPSLRMGGYGTCLFADLATNGALDPATPSGTTWTYIVTGENAVGEGPMGWTSLGSARLNQSPCP